MILPNSRQKIPKNTRFLIVECVEDIPGWQVAVLCADGFYHVHCDNCGATCLRPPVSRMAPARGHYLCTTCSRILTWPMDSSGRLHPGGPGFEEIA